MRRIVKKSIFEAISYSLKLEAKLSYLSHTNAQIMCLPHHAQIMNGEAEVILMKHILDSLLGEKRADMRDRKRRTWGNEIT